MSEERKAFITTTHGMRGWFAVHMWWNNKDIEGHGFWEPWQSGIGSYKTEAEAAKEGRIWAEAEGLEFKEAMPSE
jgi:hypothetical protein